MSPRPLPISCFHSSFPWGRPLMTFPTCPVSPPTSSVLPRGPLPPASLLWLSGSSVVCLLRVLAGDKGRTAAGLAMGNPEMVDFRLVPRHGYVGRHVFPECRFLSLTLPGGGFSTWGKVRPGGVRSTEQACNAGLAISPGPPPAWAPQAPGHLSSTTINQSLSDI